MQEAFYEMKYGEGGRRKALSRCGESREANRAEQDLSNTESFGSKGHAIRHQLEIERERDFPSSCRVPSSTAFSKIFSLDSSFRRIGGDAFTAYVSNASSSMATIISSRKERT